MKGDINDGAAIDTIETRRGGGERGNSWKSYEPSYARTIRIRFAFGRSHDAVDSGPSCVVGGRDDDVARFVGGSIAIALMNNLAGRYIANFRKVRDYSRRRVLRRRRERAIIVLRPARAFLVTGGECARSLCLHIHGFTHISVCVCVYVCLRNWHTVPGGEFACTLRNEACIFLYNLARVHSTLQLCEQLSSGILILSSRAVHEYTAVPTRENIR